MSTRRRDIATRAAELQVSEGVDMIPPRAVKASRRKAGIRIMEHVL